METRINPEKENKPKGHVGSGNLGFTSAFIHRSDNQEVSRCRQPWLTARIGLRTWDWTADSEGRGTRAVPRRDSTLATFAFSLASLGVALGCWPGPGGGGLPLVTLGSPAGRSPALTGAVRPGEELHGSAGARGRGGRRAASWRPRPGLRPRPAPRLARPQRPPPCPQLPPPPPRSRWAPRTGRSATSTSRSTGNRVSRGLPGRWSAPRAGRGEERAGRPAERAPARPAWLVTSWSTAFPSPSRTAGESAQATEGLVCVLEPRDRVVDTPPLCCVALGIPVCSHSLIHRHTQGDLHIQACTSTHTHT